MDKILIKTTKRNELIDITPLVQQCLGQKDIKSGLCVVYCPHTTGSITVNESYDSDVQLDICFSLNKISPDYSEFRHAEGNSDAHVKTSLVGASETFIIGNGKIALGTWQGIYFTEFDGPRTREVWIKIIEG